MVRLVFRPYTQLRQSICTSELLRSSIRVSPDFNLARHSSPSFGSQHLCSVYSQRSEVDWKSRIKGLGAVALIYFLFLFIAGNFILLNVFLAIAVDNLSTDGDEEEGGGEEEQPAIPDDMVVGPDGTLIPIDMKDELKLDIDGYFQDDDFKEEFIHYPEEDDEGNFEEPKKERVIEDPSPVNKVEPIPEGASFFIFSQDNSLRIFCHWLQGHPIMGNFILVCIIVSSALLACEDPLRSKSAINNVSQTFRVGELNSLFYQSTVSDSAIF